MHVYMYLCRQARTHAHIPTPIHMHTHTEAQAHRRICDWICEKGSYTRNYKYLEIQF